MKNILLAIFVSLPFLSISQSLQLSEQRIVKEDDLYKGMLTVTNISGNEIEVRVKREVEVLANGHVTYFCWGNCYGPGTSESPDSRPIAAGGFDAGAFYGDLESAGLTGLSKVKYTFFDKRNPSDEVSYTFIYDISSGIQVNSVSDADLLSSVFPNPVQSIGKVKFDLSGKKYSDALLVVRSLTGSIVKSYKISQANGEVTINTDQFGNGIYMYSLVVDGKAILTRKMTVTN